MKKQNRVQNNIQSASAKERLFEAAMDVFGRYGFEAATTRMIARAAGVNIAAIPYYFEGKEGLYHALVKRVVELVRSRIAQVQEDIAALDQSEEGDAVKAAALLERLLEKLIMFMVGSDQAPRVSRIILREQLYPSSAYDIIFKGFMESLLDSITDLLEIIAPHQKRGSLKIRAMAIMGQVIVFRVGRETAVRALDMVGYSEEEARAIRQVVIEHTRTVITSLKEEK